MPHKACAIVYGLETHGSSGEQFVCSSRQLMVVVLFSAVILFAETRKGNHHCLSLGPGEGKAAS